MKVKVVKEIPVREAIASTLFFVRSKPHDIATIRRDGSQQTTLELYEETVHVRTDIGMVNMVSGVYPEQIIIELDTLCPIKPKDWQEEVIQIWFDKHGERYHEEAENLKVLCEVYPQYKKHFGKFFDTL